MWTSRDLDMVLRFATATAARTWLEKYADAGTASTWRPHESSNSTKENDPMTMIIDPCYEGNYPSDISEPAERGAALLDQRWPGWYELIDLDELDLKFTYSCVLGQLGRTTDSGVIADLTNCDTDLGFFVVADVHGDEYEDDRRWGLLTSVWHELIERRLDGWRPADDVIEVSD